MDLGNSLEVAVRTDLRLEEINNEEVRGLYPVIFSYAFIMVVGVVGNALVLLVYSMRYKRSPARVYILFLASVDFSICLFGLPYHLIDLTHPYTYNDELSCQILTFIIANLFHMSVFGLIVVAVDRYLKICHPLGTFQVSYFGKKRACFVATVSAVLLSWPYLILYGPSEMEAPATNLTGHACFFHTKYLETSYPFIFTLIVLCVCLFSTMLLVVLYTVICHRIIVRYKCSIMKQTGNLICDDTDITEEYDMKTFTAGQLKASPARSVEQLNGVKTGVMENGLEVSNSLLREFFQECRMQDDFCENKNKADCETLNSNSENDTGEENQELDSENDEKDQFKPERELNRHIDCEQGLTRHAIYKFERSDNKQCGQGIINHVRDFRSNTKAISFQADDSLSRDTNGKMNDGHIESESRIERTNVNCLEECKRDGNEYSKDASGDDKVSDDGSDVEKHDLVLIKSTLARENSCNLLEDYITKGNSNSAMADVSSGSGQAKIDDEQEARAVNGEPTSVQTVGYSKKNLHCPLKEGLSRKLGNETVARDGRISYSNCTLGENCRNSTETTETEVISLKEKNSNHRHSFLIPREVDICSSDKLLERRNSERIGQQQRAGNQTWQKCKSLTVLSRHGIHISRKNLDGLRFHTSCVSVAPSNRSSLKIKPPLSRQHYKITKIMLTVTCVFILSYAPALAVTIYSIVQTGFWDNLTRTETIICEFFLRFYLLNNICNPFIYGFWDRRFKREVVLSLRKVYNKMCPFARG